MSEQTRSPKTLRKRIEESRAERVERLLEMSEAIRLAQQNPNNLQANRRLVELILRGW